MNLKIKKTFTIKVEDSYCIHHNIKYYKNFLKKEYSKSYILFDKENVIFKNEVYVYYLTC